MRLTAKAGKPKAELRPRQRHRTKGDLNARDMRDGKGDENATREPVPSKHCNGRKNEAPKRA